MVGEAIGSAYVTIGLDTKALDSGLNAAKSSVAAATTDMGNMGSKITAGFKGHLEKGRGDFSSVGKDLGNSLTQGLEQRFGAMGGMAGGLATAIGPIGIAAGIAGAALIGLGAASVNAAQNWQSLMTNVGKTTGLDASGLAALSTELTNISTRSPIAATDLAKIASVAGSLGVGDGLMGADKAKEIAEFSDVASQMAVAFEMPAEQAATSSAKILTAFNQPINTKNMEGLGNIVNTMGDNYAATESQVLDFTNRASYLNTTFGMSIPQVAAWGTTLISSGMEAETASTGIKSLMNMSMDPKKFDAFAKAAGMSGEELKKSLNEDVMGTYSMVADKISSGTDAVEKFQTVSKLAGAEGMTTLMKMAGKGDVLQTATTQAEEQQTLADTGQSGSMGNTFEAQSSTMSAQLVMLKNSANAILRDIGSPLLGPISAGIGMVSSGLNAARGAGEAVFGAVTGSAAFQQLSNIGGTISKTIGSVAGSISKIFSTIGGSINKAMGGDALGKIFNGLTAPLALSLGLINQMVGLIGSGVASGWEAVAGTVEAVASALETASAYIQAFAEVTGIKSAFDSVKTTIEGIISKVTEIGSKISSGLATAIPTAISGLQGALASLAGQFGALITQAISGPLGEVASALGLGDIASKFGGISARAGEILNTNIEEEIKSGASAGIEEGLTEGAAAGAPAAANEVSDAFSDAINKKTEKGVSKELAYWMAWGNISDEAALEMVNSYTQSKKGYAGLFGRGNVSRVIEDQGVKFEIRSHATSTKTEVSLVVDGQTMATGHGYASKKAAIEDLFSRADVPLSEAASLRLQGRPGDAALVEMQTDVITDSYLNFADDFKSELANAGKDISQAFLDGMTPERENVKSRLDSLISLRLYDPEEAKRQGADTAIAYLYALNNAIEAFDYAKVRYALKPDDEGAKSDFKKTFDQIQYLADNMPAELKVKPVLDLTEFNTVKAKEFDFSEWVKTPNLSDIYDKKVFAKEVFQPSVVDEATSALNALNLSVSNGLKPAQDLIIEYKELAAILPALFTPLQLTALNSYDGSTDSTARTLGSLSKKQDEVKKKAEDLTVGFNALADTAKACGECVSSAFGDWQESQFDLFRPGYIGQGGQAYLNWKNPIDAAIAETQAATKSVGGTVTDTITKTLTIDDTQAKQAVSDVNTAASAKVTKILSIDASAAQSAILAINAAAGAPITKTVYVQEVYMGTSSSGNTALPITKFAKGGLTNGPEFFTDSGKLSVRGEAGPELILPLSDPDRTNELLDTYLPEARPFAEGGIVGGPRPQKPSMVSNLFNTINSVLSSKTISEAVSSTVSRKSIDETLSQNAITKVASAIDNSSITRNSVSKDTHTSKTISDTIQSFVTNVLKNSTSVVSAIEKSVSSNQIREGRETSHISSYAIGTKTDGPELAVIGEDGPSNPEYVIPTKTKRWDLMFAAMRSYGIPGYAEGTSTGDDNWLGGSTEIDTKLDGIAENTGDALPCMMNTEENTEATGEKLEKVDDNVCKLQSAIQNMGANIVSVTASVAGAWGANGGTGGRYGSFFGGSSWKSGGAAGVGAGWDKEPSWGGEAASDRLRGVSSGYTMPPIFQFAKGGLTNGAQLFTDRGRLAVRGEAGPELILPLSNPTRTNELLHMYLPMQKFADGGIVGGTAPVIGRGGNSDTGGNTFNLTTQINGSGLSADELDAVISRNNKKLIEDLNEKMSEAGRS